MMMIISDTKTWWSPKTSVVGRAVVHLEQKRGWRIPAALMIISIVILNTYSYTTSAKVRIEHQKLKQTSQYNLFGVRWDTF